LQQQTHVRTFGSTMKSAAKLAQEAEFFDRWADANAKRLEPTDPAVVERYRRTRGLSPKEYCFQLLGELRGKTILDVGCGEGEDAMILAKLGARVTGLDVSPGAIALATERAALNGVSDRVRFVCAALNAGDLPPRSFDVIWIDNVLHHVLDDLERTMGSLLQAAKPGALVICIEPVNLNKTLRKIRFLVPVHTEVTPGERPLEKHDLAILEKLLPGLRKKHFVMLGRLVRFVIPGYRYERASWWRRTLADSLIRLDRVLLAIPGLEALGGLAILHARASAG
jgi:2-polyprenyl-3-methyl-5-hydroxy-6-metoxy-1,4-benzoquinol methylase